MKNESKNELAEKLEKQRYRAIFGQTVSFAVWFGALIAALFIKDAGMAPDWAKIMLAAVILIGIVPFVFYCFKLSAVTGRIARDPEIRSAVNNEMYIANDRKAGVWGYYITLFASFIMFMAANNTAISALAATGVVLYVAALSAKVSQLIVHRG